MCNSTFTWSHQSQFSLPELGEGPKFELCRHAELVATHDDFVLVACLFELRWVFSQHCPKGHITDEYFSAIILYSWWCLLDHTTMELPDTTKSDLVFQPIDTQSLVCLCNLVSCKQIDVLLQILQLFFSCPLLFVSDPFWCTHGHILKPWWELCDSDPTLI